MTGIAMSQRTATRFDPNPDLDKAFKLLRLQVSDTFNKYVRKGVARKEMAKADPKDLRKVETEIEDQEPPEPLAEGDEDLGDLEGAE